MGVYQSIHIGPYLQVKRTDGHKEVQIRQCPNCTDKPKRHTDFCQDCGTRTVIEKVLIPELTSVLDLMHKESYLSKYENDLVHARTFNPEFEYVFPNHRVPDGIEFEYGDAGATPITPDRSARELMWFITEYADHIKMFREFFGDDNVTIEWGIIVTYS